MANTIDWGKAAINNTLGFGQAAKNSTLGFGEIEATSWSGETNITGTPSTPSFSNTQSIALDGIDDFVAISANSNLQISDTFTISQWIKFTSTNQMYVTNFGNDYGTYVQNGKFGIVFRNTSNAQKGLSSTVNINDGNWHHVLAIKTTTNIYLYVDGVLESNSQGDVGRISTRSAAIGALFNGSLFYNGNIDEVALWNTDQSSNASSIYNGGTPTDLSTYSPLSWWRCGDGDTAPILSDNGSGGNNGTMTNFSTFSTDVPT